MKQQERIQMQLLVAPVAGDILGAWLFEMFLGWEIETIKHSPHAGNGGWMYVVLNKFPVDE